MGKYILLKRNRAKTTLIGTKSKPYTAQIDNNIVTNWYLMDEAWLVTNVYMGNKGVIAQSLRATHPDIGPNEIDMFIDMVKKDHPLEHVDFNWNDIPLYATTKSYCDLFLPWLYKSPIKLTQKQEKELLEIVRDDKDNKKLRMTNWFYRYRRDYGIDSKLKRDRETQDEELASLFCLVHGFDLSEVNSIFHKKNKKKTSNTKSTIRGFLVFFLIFMGTFGLLLLGNESESWIIGILCAIPFFLVLGWISDLMKGK